MISALLIAAALASTSQTTTFVPTAETRAYVQTYKVCIFSKTQQLERSGAEPRDIIAASLTSCVQKKKDLQASLYADAVIQEADGKGRISSDRIERALQVIDDRISAEARLKLLEIRASKRNR